MPRYHVTPTRNLDSIFQGGISPQYATGKRKVAWFVSKARLPWAIAHISNRHNVSVRDLTVLEVPGISKRFTRTCWPGVWTCQEITLALKWAPAAEWIPGVTEEEEQSDSEARRF